MAGGCRSLCCGGTSRSCRPPSAPVAEEERGDADAALREARLAATEACRAEYREAARRLARRNAELLWRQQRAEREAAAVAAFLTKQGREEAEETEKLKQELIDLKQQAQEEKQQLLKESMEISNRRHQEVVARMERRFLQEKERLEGDVERKQIMMAEAAQHEAVLEKIQFEKVDISELTWEQKERVLRLLFAKMNGTNPWKYTRVLATSPPAPDDTKEESEIGTENTSPDLIFITQQAKISDSSSSAVIHPCIRKLTPQTE